MKEADRNPFRIANPTAPQPAVAAFGGEAGSPLERVERMVKGSRVFLFMKGVPAAPRCGFSANAVSILAGHGLPFESFDVLSDEAIRAAAKEYASWPTFPQLWVDGELVGGHDILVEMHQSGELAELARGLAR